MAKKLTPAQIRKRIKEEEEGAKDYHKHGFHDLAKDEERHARVLKKKLKEAECKKK